MTGPRGGAPADDSGSRLRIREMQGDDMGPVVALSVRGNEEHLAAFPPPVATAYRAEIENLRARLDTCDVLVAEVDGRVVGSATLVRDARDDSHPWPPGGAVLRLLVVDPEARGTGVATALTAECLRRARVGGVAYVGLHTAPMMAAARRLYERAGFRRAPEHDFDPGLHYGGMAGDDGAPMWGLAYMLTFDE